ncbi:MAG TPA: class I SAM-dependent methyltransferase [Gemmataceae bacterium]|nr:class I SAM-dependent methyltransferase [Gemmataceae bacterium]
MIGASNPFMSKRSVPVMQQPSARLRRRFLIGPWVAHRPHVHHILWMLGLTPATTQTTVNEQDCLVRHAAGRKRLVEIGVWHGFNSRRLREVMAPDGVLFAVDPFPIGRFRFNPQFLVARGEVHAVRNGCVRWMRMTGVEAGQAFRAHGEEPVDFIFIDGDHSYEGLRGDWQIWSELLACGGIMALHDSRSTPERPIDEAGSVVFTNEVIRNDPRYEIVETVDSMTILCRRTLL